MTKEVNEKTGNEMSRGEAKRWKDGGIVSLALVLQLLSVMGVHFNT